MYNQEINNYKANKKVKVVEYAFVSKMRGKDVFFVKAEGVNPTAYILPDGFLTKLQAKFVQDSQPKELFSLGRKLTTPGAVEALGKSCQEAEEFISRHHSGDWGDVCNEDREENDFSVKEGFRLLSSYKTSLGEKIWVITEADRSATTLLLPKEY